MNEMAQMVEANWTAESTWEFARDKVGKWLLYTPAGMVGRVAKVYAAGEYSNRQTIDAAGNHSTVTVAVIEFASGDALLAKPQHFEVLAENEAAFYLLAVKQVSDALEVCVKTQVAMAPRLGPIEFPKLVMLLRAALQGQIRVLATK